MGKAARSRDGRVGQISSRRLKTVPRRENLLDRSHPSRNAVPISLGPSASFSTHSFLGVTVAAGMSTPITFFEPGVNGSGNLVDNVRLVKLDTVPEPATMRPDFNSGRDQQAPTAENQWVVAPAHLMIL